MPSFFSKKTSSAKPSPAPSEPRSPAPRLDERTEFPLPTPAPDRPSASPSARSGSHSPEKRSAANPGPGPSVSGTATGKTSSSSRSSVGGGLFAREKSSSSSVSGGRASPRAGFGRKDKDSSRRRSSSSEEHPLNLPPDQLRRLSRLSAQMSLRDDAARSPQPQPKAQTPATDRMDTASPAPEPSPPAASAANGANGVDNASDDNDDDRPVPPPHRTPASPQPAPVDKEAEKEKIDPETFKAAGNKFYKAQQYDRAIAEYSKAIEADPQSATFLSNRAAAYMAAGRYIEALEDCKMADEREPDATKILHRLAKIYTALGRPQEALDTLARISPPVSQKDKAQATAMQWNIEQAQENLLSSSSGSMVIHALDQAEKGLGFGVSPPRKWRLMRGEAFLRLGNINSLGEAQSIAMSLLRNNNADPEALVLRGRALYAQGDNEKAIQHFRQALSYDPDFKDAVRYMRMVQKLDRMKEEGNTHYKAGRYQEAVGVYTSALDVDPLNKGTNSKILNNRAMCYSKLKQWDTAIQDCDKAVQLDPSYTKARKTRAKALGEGGDWEEAVRAYKSIQEQSPEEPGIAKDVRNAELELKKSKRKDYYKILGIEKDATEQDIKKAYRKLAVKHHPDKNIDDPDAENRFKDLQEAHETLVDPQRRERYDSGVDLQDPSDAFGGAGGFPGFGGMHGGGVQIDPEMLFNMMGGMGGGRGRGAGPGGFPGGGFTFSTGGGRGGGGFPFG